MASKACDRGVPICARCVKRPDPSLECTYRAQRKNGLDGLGVKLATKDVFKLEKRNRNQGTTRPVACKQCRANKKACDGDITHGCERCRRRHLECSLFAKPYSEQPDHGETDTVRQGPASTTPYPLDDDGYLDYVGSDGFRGEKIAFEDQLLEFGDNALGSLPTVITDTELPNKTDFATSLVTASKSSGFAFSFSPSESLPRHRPRAFDNSLDFFGHSSSNDLALTVGVASGTRSILERAPTITRMPGVPWLPDVATINQLIDAYFTGADVTLVMLHKGRFQAKRQQPDLLICSILLLAPHMTASPIVGRQTREQIHHWDRSLFHRAKGEMVALLSSGSPVAIDAVAAVVNLAVWALFKGLNALAGHLRELAPKLLDLMGLVEDAKTLSPRPGLPTWSETMVLAFGPDIFSRRLDERDLNALQNLWIDYYTRERVVTLVVHFNLITRDWTRKFEPSNADYGYPDLRRVMPPMPNVWEASHSPDFDPRLLPEPPILIDVLAPLLMGPDDPRRAQGFQKLTHYFLSERKTVTWVFHVLRDKVDRFLAACTEAGYQTPAALPNISTNDEASLRALDTSTADLLRRRSELDSTILLTRAALPAQVKKGLSNGSAGEIVEALLHHSGSFWYAFNHVTYFSAIVLLRLELYSSCGVYLTMKAVKGSATESSGYADQDTLADEFGSGGTLFAEFLEDVS